MRGSLWHAGLRVTEVNGSIEPDRDPVATSFLVLTVDRCGTAHFAYSEHGVVVRTGALEGARKVESLVSELYRESAKTSIPLVAVFEKPSYGFTFGMEHAYRAVQTAIRSLKGDSTNRMVIIPRLLTLPKRVASYRMFGERLVGSETQIEEAENLVGASLEGSAPELARSICLAYRLSRSELGKAVTPIRSKGVAYV